MWLDSDDLKLVEELRAFLTLFRDLTLLVSESTPNIAVIPLIATKIRSICTSHLDEAQRIIDSEPMKKMKKLVKDTIDKRIVVFVVSQLVKLACCFDPGVRDVVLSKEEISKLLEETYDTLRQSKYASFIFDKLQATGETGARSADVYNDSNESGGSGPTAKKLRLSLIQEIAAAIPQSISNPLSMEITHYLALHDDDSSSLEFWNKRQSTFPLKSAMVKAFSKP